MKAWYQSKVLWFNLLAGVVSIAGLFGFTTFQPDQSTVEIIGVVVAAVNIVLRFITSTKLG